MPFLLVLVALSLPFWVVGAVTRRQIMPGLPVSAFMAMCPGLAASFLVYRAEGTPGVLGLLERSFDWERVRAIWYVPAVFLMPGIALVTYALMRATGVALPDPAFALLPASAMLGAFLVTALGEELGWSGYALAPTQRRWGALGAGILLGLGWAAWHVVPYTQAGRPPAWIAWQCLETVGFRVLLVWIYNSAGQSVFAASVCHAMGNLSVFLFPGHGSHYDPRLTGLIVAVAAAAVAVVGGPRTLARRASA